MRIVIAGATRLGGTLASRLVETGSEVVLVDKDQAALDALSDRLDCGMIRGDATLPSVLRDAAGEKPDILVALTHSDEDNILCAVVGRSVGFTRVIPQIAKVELGAICEELDLDDFITPDDTIAASLVASIEDGSSPMRASPLCGDLTLVAYEIEGALAGKRIDELVVGRKSRVISMARDGKDAFASDEMVLKEQDRIVILTERRALGDVIHELSEVDAKTAEGG